MFHVKLSTIGSMIHVQGGLLGSSNHGLERAFLHLSKYARAVLEIKLGGKVVQQQQDPPATFCTQLLGLNQHQQN